MSENPALTINARPDPVSLISARTAVIVVDLQNGYASPGGYRDLNRRDISGASRVIENRLRILAAGHAAGITLGFLQNGWDPELREPGSEGSPNLHKSNPLRVMRAHPELTGKVLTRGSWDYALVDELQPVADDLVVGKPRYSSFRGTDLEGLLREHDIKTLVFTWIAINVCVESTLRDAYFREFFCFIY